MSCELTTNVRTSLSQSTSLTPLPIPSQLLLLSLWERAKKDSNSFKTEKSFNAIPTLSKTPTYLSPVCGVWKDISGLGLRGENLPSEAGLGMSYRHLRGCKSLGPDHGFSIQLQPWQGSRAQAAPPPHHSPPTPGPRQGMKYREPWEGIALILRIKRARFWFHDSFVHTCSCKYSDDQTKWFCCNVSFCALNLLQ